MGPMGPIGPIRSKENLFPPRETSFVAAEPNAAVERLIRHGTGAVVGRAPGKHEGIPLRQRRFAMDDRLPSRDQGGVWSAVAGRRTSAVLVITALLLGGVLPLAGLGQEAAPAEKPTVKPRPAPGNVAKGLARAAKLEFKETPLQDCPGQHLRPLPRRDHPLQAGVGRGAHFAGHADHRADSLDETRQGPRRVLPASAPCLRGLRQRHRGDDGDASRGRAGHAGVSPFHAAGRRPRREPQGGERFSHRSSADSQAKGRAQIVG